MQVAQPRQERRVAEINDVSAFGHISVRPHRDNPVALNLNHRIVDHSSLKRIDQ